MSEDNPSTSKPHLVQQPVVTNGGHEETTHKISWFKKLFANKTDEKLRDTLEGLIEEENGNGTDMPAINHSERMLLLNILKLRDLTVWDVMIPRADIIAVEEEITKEQLLAMYADKPRSRLPIYTETLDHIVGTVHIKDFLGQTAKNEAFNLKQITREVPIISPSMPVLDLLLQMQETRNHMALVIDEYGGIDGLVTLGDLLESITGGIEDLYDEQEEPQIKRTEANVFIADARLPIDDFEKHIGEILLDEEEREEIDTLAGFLFSIAGRVPVKSEIIKHDSGLEFEVVDGDVRQIRKIKVRQLSTGQKAASV